MLRTRKQLPRSTTPMKRSSLAPVGAKKLAAASGRVFSTFTGERVGINQVSAKRRVKLAAEAVVKRLLWKKQGGCCADCGWKAPSIGDLDKHEDLTRARLGDPTDISNCVLLCRACHDLRHATNNLLSGHRPITQSPWGKPWRAA